MLFFNSKPLRAALQKLTDCLITRAMGCGLPEALQANGEVLDILNWLSRALKADLLTSSEPIKRCYENSLLLMHEWTGGDQCWQLLTDHNLGRCAVQLSTIINDTGIDLFTAVHAGPAQSSQPSFQTPREQVLQTNGALLQECILQICAPAVLSRLVSPTADVIALLNIGNLVRYAIEKRVLAVDDPQVTPMLAHFINVVGKLSAVELVGSRKDCRPLSNFANLLRTLVEQEVRHAMLFQQSLFMLGTVCAHLIDCINSADFGSSNVESQSLSNLITFVKVCDRMLERRAAAIGSATTTSSSNAVVSSMATPLTQATLIDASHCLVKGIDWYGAGSFSSPAAMGGLLAGLAYLWRRNLVPPTPAMGILLQSLLDQIGCSDADAWTDKSKRVVLPVLEALLELGMTTPEKALRALTRLIPGLESGASQRVLAVLGKEIVRLDGSRDAIIALPLAQPLPVATKVFPIPARGLGEAPPGWTRILEPLAAPQAPPVWPVGSRNVALNTGSTATASSTTTTSSPAWRSVGKQTGAGSQQAEIESSTMPESDREAESDWNELVGDSQDSASTSRSTAKETQQLRDSGKPPQKQTAATHAAGTAGAKGTKKAKRFQQKKSSPVGALLAAADHGAPNLARIILAGNAPGVMEYFMTNLETLSALKIQSEVFSTRFHVDMNLALDLVMTNLDTVDSRILEALSTFFKLLIDLSPERGTELLHNYFATHEPQFAGLRTLLGSLNILVEEVKKTAGPQAKKTSRRRRAANQLKVVDVTAYVKMSDGTSSQAMASFAVFSPNSASASQQIDPNAPEGKPAVTTCSGAGALCLAAQNNEVDIVRKLLISVPATARSEGQTTALMLAAQNGCTRVVRVLLDHGPVEAQLLAAHETGTNSLMLAAMHNQIDVVKMLLAAGSVSTQLTLCDNEGRNALFNAVIGGHADLVRLLLDIDCDGQQASIQNIRGTNAMMFAAQANFNAIVRMLLASPMGAQQVVAQDKEGRNALMYAIHMKHDETIRLLLGTRSARQQATALDLKGFNALTLAASTAFERGVRLLLNADFADDLAPPSSEHGASALSIAAQGGHVNIVRILLKLKSAERQSEYVSRNNTCALILAVSGGHLAVVKELLLLKNARKQASIVNSHGRTALAIAKALNYPAIIKLLKPYSPE